MTEEKHNKSITEARQKQDRTSRPTNNESTIIMSTLFQAASHRVFVPVLHRYTIVNSISRRSMMMSFEEKVRLKVRYEC